MVRCLQKLIHIVYVQNQLSYSEIVQDFVLVTNLIERVALQECFCLLACYKSLLPTKYLELSNNFPCKAMQ